MQNARHSSVTKALRAMSGAMACVFFLTIGTPLASRVQAQEPPREHVVDDAPAPAVEHVDPDVARPDVVDEVRTSESSDAIRESGAASPAPGPVDTPERIPSTEPLTLPTGPGKSAVTPQAISLP